MKGIGWRSIALSGGVLLAGAFAFDRLTWGFDAFTAEAARQQAVLAQPAAVPLVAGHDQTGRVLALTDDPLGTGPGRIAIVDFVYTRCTTLCSALGASYQRLQAQIVAAHLQDRVRLVTVSFDPEHDTPAVIANYAQRMHADPTVWTVLTLSNPADLPVLLHTFGVVVIPAPMEQFQHNAALHLVDAQGWLVQIMDIDQPGAALAEALRRAATPRTAGGTS